jgi:hypothetical protein
MFKRVEQKGLKICCSMYIPSLAVSFVKSVVCILTPVRVIVYSSFAVSCQQFEEMHQKTKIIL